MANLASDYGYGQIAIKWIWNGYAIWRSKRVNIQDCGRKRVIYNTDVFKNIMRNRERKFKSALWTNLDRLLDTKLSFSTAYNPQTDGLEEIMRQTLENMIRRFCAYGLELKDSD
ncbi:hypothetical protein O181_062112 [Austropuccinia psidii MF-1]|uniref:Integrase catalytic domain-containing protein n=1 Tax=Austropuccinia psidii MF-1 TaxID=1389203 RepID=A0A9Q3EM14_9BASI|nr:hypothetical protein [Austropuccinia psidii MF-1]